MLDELMVATQHLIGWEEGAAELARLRRLADVGSKTWRDYGFHIAESQFANKCTICERIALETAPLVHAHDCDAAIHLGLERESET